MAEILVNARAMSDWQLGHPVHVAEDGQPWGTEERLPKFVVLKLPLVPAARVMKYVQDEGLVRPRTWRIRWAALPQAARDKLTTVGELVILVPAYGYQGPFDYTWTQVKQFFRNDVTGLDEILDPEGLAGNIRTVIG